MKTSPLDLKNDRLYLKKDLIADMKKDLKKDLKEDIKEDTKRT